MLTKIQNKRGWIKVVEAFAAILIIAGVVLIAISQSKGAKEDIPSRIHNDQIFILRDIELNNSLRSEVINQSLNTPVEWANFPINLKNRIVAKTPNYMNCSAKICTMNDLCLLTGLQEKNVYAESAIIAATLQTYNPRQLKLFCWTE